MRVLIVGAGSIGQLYGMFLQRGGATVDVYIKPKYREDANAGYRLYDRRKGLRAPEVFTPDGVCTSPDDLSGDPHDVVLLCMSSAGLHGPWFEDFAPAIGDTTLISLTPGLDDRRFITDHIDDEQVGMGLITAVSYPAPLPGEEAAEPGTAYWLPPLTPAFFDGPLERLRPLMKTLNQGGMRARRMRDLSERAAMGTALLMPLVAVLEIVDWSIATLRKSKEHRNLLDEAADEALAVVEERFDTRRPLPTRILGPMTWRGLLIAAPVVPPFDLETYLQVHFTKTGEQTRMFIDGYIERRRSMEIPSPALEQLRGELK